MNTFTRLVRHLSFRASAGRFLALALLAGAMIPARAATIIWTNLSGGNWSAAANWSPNTVPGVGDTAQITVQGNYSVTLDVSPTIAGLQLGSVIAGTTQSFFTGSQTLTVNGSIVVNSQGQFDVNGGALAGTFDVTGAITWSGGGLTGNMTIDNNSFLNIVAGGGNSLEGLVLTNNGTVNWTNTTIYAMTGNNTLIYNYGTWNAQSDNTFEGHYNSGYTFFENFGNFVKSGTAGTTVLDTGVIFTNLGTVEVDSGTLNIEAGASTGGTFTTTGPGNIDFYNYYFTNTTTFNGLGSYLASATTFGGSYTGTLNWDGGNVTGTLTIPNNATLNIIPGGGNSLDGLVLTNQGTVNWTNTTIYAQTGNNTLIYNYGTWNAQSDNTFEGHFNAGYTFFENFGMFLKSGHTGATVLDTGVIFTNLGTVEVDSGTLDIEAGMSSGATFTTTGPGIINISSYLFTNTTTFTGLSNYVAGAATFEGSFVGTLNWDGGILNGVLTIPGGSVLNIIPNGGNGFNGLLLTNNGTVNWTNVDLYGLSGNNAQIYNYGLWNAQSDNSFDGNYNGGSSLFENFGMFRKTGNTGTTTLETGVIFNNTSSGTVEVDSGTLNIAVGTSTGGTFTTTGPGILNFISTAYNFTNVTTFNGASNFLTSGANFEGSYTGILNWEAGSVAGVLTIPGGSVFNIIPAGGGNGFNGLLLTNNGTVNWTNVDLYGVGGNNVQIYNYGLWNAQTDNSFDGNYNGGTSLFENFGTFRKSGKTGTTTLETGVIFNNTSSGTVEVDSGTLDIALGTSTGSHFITSGPGILNFISTAYNFTNVTTFTGISNYLSSGANFEGSSYTGTLNWDGGSLTGVLTIPVGSFFNIVTGGGNGFNGLTLTNNGTVNWTNVDLYGLGGNNAQIYNYGLWNAQSDDAFDGNYNGGSTLFDNFGTFLKSGNAGTTTLESGVAFTNIGLVDVESGTLDIGAGTSSGGTFKTVGGTTLNFISTPYYFTKDTIFLGTGSFLNSGGTFAGSIEGTLSWDGGSLTGVLTVNSDGVFDIVPGGGDGFNGLALTNRGTVNWGATDLYSLSGNNAQIYNYGAWNALSDDAWDGNYNGGATIFDNFGTFLKMGTSGSTTLGSGILFTNTGTVSVQSGTVAFQDVLAQNQGTLLFGLNSTSTYGKIGVSGALPLNGTLGINLLGGYMPALGDTFTPLTSAADSLTFNNLNLTPVPAGDAWQVTYNAASVKLQIVTLGATDAQISGTVTDAPTHGVPNITVFAFTTNNPDIYLTTTTDGNGNYTLNVTNGNWTVGLENLPAAGYNSVPDQMTTTSSGSPDQVVNFSIQAIGATAPTATTTAPGSVTSVSATLNGTVVPNGEAVSVYFEYGTSSLNQFTPTNTITANLSLIQGVNIPIAGLSPGTQYQFQLVAQNSVGTTPGGIINFATLGIAPATVTTPATLIGPTNAVVNGTVNPGGLPTTYYFEYGTNTTYNLFTVTNLLPAGNTTLVVTNSITNNLMPATVYHYQLVASNGVAIGLGGDLTFTNLPAAPVAVTLAAAPVTISSATLNGTVLPNGLPTTWYFEYGTDTTYGTLLPASVLPGTNITLAVSSPLSGLGANNTYHFQLIASNSLGTNLGGDQMFSTGSVGATISCPSDITVSSATGECGQMVSWSETVGGNPSPTVVCMFAGNPISSPFFFPIGTNLVTCTASNVGGMQACSFNVIVTDSQPPIAGANSMGTYQAKPASVSVVKMLVRDTTQRGGPLSISSVSPTTPGGASVSLGGGLITYTPPPTLVGLDTITYTLSDGCGTSQGTIQVTVLATNLPANNFISITPGGSGPTIVFAGVPGVSYVVQYAPTTSGPWSNLSGPVVAASNGLIQYTDSPPPPTRFYRTQVYVPAPSAISN